MFSPYRAVNTFRPRYKHRVGQRCIHNQSLSVLGFIQNTASCEPKYWEPAKPSADRIQGSLAPLRKANLFCAVLMWWVSLEQKGALLCNWRISVFVWGTVSDRRNALQWETLRYKRICVNTCYYLEKAVSKSWKLQCKCTPVTTSSVILWMEFTVPKWANYGCWFWNLYRPTWSRNDKNVEKVRRNPGGESEQDYWCLQHSRPTKRYMPMHFNRRFNLEANYDKISARLPKDNRKQPALFRGNVKIAPKNTNFFLRP